MLWKQIIKNFLNVWTFVIFIKWQIKGQTDGTEGFDPPSCFLLPSCTFPLPRSFTDLLSIFSCRLIAAEQQWAQHICQQLGSVSSSSSLLLFMFSSPVCPPHLCPPTSSSSQSNSQEITRDTKKQEKANLPDKKRMRVECQGCELQENHIFALYKAIFSCSYLTLTIM